MINHSGQHNTGQRGSGIDNDKRDASLLLEPCRRGRHGCVEDGAQADQADDRLREECLIVLGRQASHPQVEAVDGGPGEE